MIYNLNTLTAKEFEEMKEQSINWGNDHLGNYSNVMIDKETLELWLDVHTESSWTEYHNEKIVDLNTYIQSQSGYSFTDYNITAFLKFANEMLAKDWDGTLW